MCVYLCTSCMCVCMCVCVYVCVLLAGLSWLQTSIRLHMLRHLPVAPPPAAVSPLRQAYSQAGNWAVVSSHLGSNPPHNGISSGTQIQDGTQFLSHPGRGSCLDNVSFKQTVIGQTPRQINSLCDYVILSREMLLLASEKTGFLLK